MIVGILSENSSADRRKFVKVRSADAASFFGQFNHAFSGSIWDNAHLVQTVETRFAHRTFQTGFSSVADVSGRLMNS